MSFAARGFHTFVLNYSTGFDAAGFAPLQELSWAIGYIRENAEKWHIDPNKIVSLGFSAGGHLCGTLGTLFDAPEVADIGPADRLRPDALVLCNPVSVARGRTHRDSFVNLCGEDRVLMDRLSLDHLVRRDMMPVFLWHTRTDDSVPVDGTMALAAALAEQDVPFSLHVFAEGRHGLATGDDLVYRRDNLPSVSEGVLDWPELAVRFLWEQGFHIRDGA